MKINKHMKKKIAKSLKELYNESLICEMPKRMPEQHTQEYLKYLEENFENDEKNHIAAEKFIKGIIGKQIDVFKNLEELNIYEREELNRDNEPLLIYVLINMDRKEIVGFVKLIKITYNKNKVHFSTYGLWKKKTFAGSLIFDFFTKWLLPKFKLIISDKGTTDLGEKLWIKIAKYGLTHNKECGIFKVNAEQDEEQFIRLYKIEDFSNAWEELEEDPIFQRIYIKE